MGSRLRCCFGPCLVFNDDFGDAASPDLSGDWTEEAGTWSYDGVGHVEEAGAVNASILTVAETKTIEQHVSTSIDLMVSGRKYRLIYNAVNEQNYHFVEIELGVPDVIRWYKRTGGNNDLLREENMESGGPEEVDTTFSVCSTSVSSTVEFSPSPPGQLYYHCDPILFENGKKAGVGNGTAAFIEFDDFRLENYRGTDGENPTEYECCTQQCLCEKGGKYCIPHILTATLFAPDNPPDLNGCRSVFHGETFDLVFNPVDGSWQSYDSNTEFMDGFTPPETGSEGAHPVCVDTAFWAITCGNTGCGATIPAGKKFMLTNKHGAVDCPGFDDCTEFEDAETSYTCDPTIITFPTQAYAVEEPPLNCGCCDENLNGWVWMVVTEQ